jgi:elongation factor P
VASTKYIDVRKGQVIVGENGQLFAVVDREHITPGNWRAILNLKLKNLKTGSTAVNRVKPDDKVEVAYLDRRQMEYLYAEGDGYVFMDKESFDQLTLGKEWVGDQMKFIKENESVQVVMFEGKPISLDMPKTVELKVIETEPSVKGATAAAQYKPATLETGAKITVPPFISTGDVIQVDTEEEKYLGRVNK